VTVAIWFFIIRNLPAIEKFVEWVWKDYQLWKENQIQQVAAKQVQKALAEANTTEINNLIGKDE